LKQKKSYQTTEADNPVGVTVTVSSLWCWKKNSSFSANGKGQNPPCAKGQARAKSSESLGIP